MRPHYIRVTNAGEERGTGRAAADMLSCGLRAGRQTGQATQDGIQACRCQSLVRRPVFLVVRVEHVGRVERVIVTFTIAHVNVVRIFCVTFQLGGLRARDRELSARQHHASEFV